ncbi:hypothetical protein QJS64_21185 (plasmid) [Paraclostridium bifermentans]|uniref:Uncharacterized protein n=1 Tax=Paraclostridium bifermentans TaxID=1490 RepID=A0ABY8R8D3_PARBF|nr:hypothetical protein QJS64_21185 [Paraclostridium bifermentans]
MDFALTLEAYAQNIHVLMFAVAIVGWFVTLIATALITNTVRRKLN